MNKLNQVQITRDQNGRELVMVRVDKTLKDFMSQKPSSRWDVAYFLPKYDLLFKQLNSTDFELAKIDDLLLSKTEGITYGQVGSREYDKNGEIQYLQVSNIRNTGLDYYIKYSRIKAGSYNDPQRSRLKPSDVLLINGGVGSLGRACVALNKDECNISQDIDRLRLKNNSQCFYIAVFLNSFFGKTQIERFTKGVSGQIKIGFDHVRSILIPILKDRQLKNIEIEYKKMSVFHDKAMGAKKNEDEKLYRENIDKAEKMLKELILKTELVITGKLNDIV